MTAFYDGKYDVLLSTAIVESGLDIPNANTLIVHRADMFGLAQLYQLRGRVGRSKARAYAYFTTPNGQRLTEGAEKRLKVLQSLDTLGAGFSLASHDLDIRGAGNLLGEEQSGHIREVGFELYQSMLEEAVAALKGGDLGEAQDQWSPQISLGTAGADPGQLRRRPAAAPRPLPAPLHAGQARRTSMRSPPSWSTASASCPQEVRHLLDVVEIKGLAKQAGLQQRRCRPQGRRHRLPQEPVRQPGGPRRLHAEVAAAASSMQPDHKLVFKADWDLPGGAPQGRARAGAAARRDRDGGEEGGVAV